MTTERKKTVVYLAASERAALEKANLDTGTPISAMCRRAIIEWLKKKGYLK